MIKLKTNENSMRLKIMLSIFMIAFSVVLALNAPTDPRMVRLDKSDVVPE